MLGTVGFNEPAFLWALTFLVGITLIHFLKRPRTIQLFFSTLRFFDESAVAAYRTRRLRRLLLLLVRLLLATVLVTLFARPFLKKDPLRRITDTQFDLHVWIDPTPSMEYLEKGVSIGEKARRIVDSIGEARDNVGIFLYDNDKGEFVPWVQLRDQPFSIRHILPVEPLRKAFETAISNANRPLFLILSDFQETTVSAVEAILRSDRAESIPIVGCRLTPEEPGNAAVVGATCDPGSEGVVAVNLRTYGGKGFAGSCFATVDHIKMPAVPCTLDSRTDTTINVVVHRPVTEGWGTVELKGDDPCTFDNVGYFIKGRSEGFSVLIAGDEKLNFPVAAALKASGEKIWGSIVMRAAEALAFPEADSADLIIVNGYRTAARPLEQLQNARASRPQAFIVAALGSDTAAGAETHLFNRLSITGVRVEAPSPLNVRLPDTVSFLWRGFPSLLIAQTRIYSYLDGITGRPLLLLTDGKPLAVSRSDAFGRLWIILASPVGITSANNLCETGFYVPFIDRLARYACSELGRRTGVWTAGRPVKNPWYGSRIPAQLYGMDRKLVLQLQQQPVFTIETPGVYKIVPPSGQPYLEAVVPDTLESRLDYRMPDRKLMNRNGAFTVVSGKELLSSLSEHSATAGWLLGWLLLGLLLFAEILIRRDRKE